MSRLDITTKLELLAFTTGVVLTMIPVAKEVKRTIEYHKWVNSLPESVGPKD